MNHPWLLRRKPGDVARDDDLVVEDDHMLGADLGDFRADNASEYGRAVSVVGADVVEAMVKKLRERYEAMVAEGGDSEEPHDMVSEVCLGYAEWQECSICYEPFDGTEIITPCPHIYCKGCISSLFTEPMRNGSVLTDEQIQLGCRSCPMCRVAIWPGKVFRAAALFEPPQDEKPEVDEAEESDDTPGPSERKGKKRAVSLLQWPVTDLRLLKMWPSSLVRSPRSLSKAKARRRTRR